MQRLFPLVFCWLICRHAQTIDYVIVQTPDPFPQSFISRTSWNSQKFWTIKTQNLFNLQVFQSFSHKCRKFFIQSCPKEFIRFLCERIISLLKGNLQSIKRHRITDFQSDVRQLFPKRTTWKQIRDILASEKGLQLVEVVNLPVINHFVLIWSCLSSFLLLCTTKVRLPIQLVTKQELPKYQPSQNLTYQIDSLKEEINKNLFSKADTLVDKLLSCPRIKLPNSQTFFLDVVETVIFLLDFAQQLRRKNADIPDIYFTLLDAAGLSPTLILNQNTKAKERGSRVPFQIWTSEAAESVHAEWSCLWVCAQLSES